MKYSAWALSVALVIMLSISACSKNPVDPLQKPSELNPNSTPEIFVDQNTATPQPTITPTPTITLIPTSTCTPVIYGSTAFVPTVELGEIYAFKVISCPALNSTSSVTAYVRYSWASLYWTNNYEIPATLTINEWGRDITITYTLDINNHQVVIAFDSGCTLQLMFCIDVHIQN